MCLLGMPFNVIAFTSTVIAFLFGSLFNLFHSTDQQIRERAQRPPIVRLRNAVRSTLHSAVQRCRRRRKEAAEQPVASSDTLVHKHSQPHEEKKPSVDADTSTSSTASSVEEDVEEVESESLSSPAARRRHER